MLRINYLETWLKVNISLLCKFICKYTILQSCGSVSIRSVAVWIVILNGLSEYLAAIGGRIEFLKRGKPIEVVGKEHIRAKLGERDSLAE